MSRKYMLVFISIGIIIVCVLGFLVFNKTALTQVLKQTSQSPSNGSQNNVNVPFTMHHRIIANGFTFTFPQNQGGIFVATLKKIYEENKNLYADIGFLATNNNSFTKKILIQSQEVTRFFILQTVPSGKIDSKNGINPESLNYSQTKNRMQKYLHQELVFTIFSANQYEKKTSGPQSASITKATSCNIPFFTNIVNKDYTSLQCVPFIEQAIVK